MTSSTYDADDVTFYTREQAEELFDIFCSDDFDLLHKHNLVPAIKHGTVVTVGKSHYNIGYNSEAIEGYAKL